MMKHYLTFSITLFLCHFIKAQVGINNTDPKATLDVTGKTNQATIADGIIAPRLTRLELINKTAYTSDQIGAIVYVSDLSGITNTATAKIGQVGYYFFNGTSWFSMNSGDEFSFGDIKTGMQATDHNGWVILDGRSIASLSPTQQSNATALGMGVNLPDATNAYLVKNNTTLGSVSGSNTRIISQSNLPNISFTGTTDSYTHNHGIGDGSNANNNVAAGQVGMSRRSSAGQSVTAVTFDATNSGNEPDILNRPRVLPNDTHNHTVTVSSGGLGTPLNIQPLSLSVNTFIYLGE